LKIYHLATLIYIGAQHCLLQFAYNYEKSYFTCEQVGDDLTRNLDPKIESVCPAMMLLAHQRKKIEEKLVKI
jgi:hypothetical protein